MFTMPESWKDQPITYGVLIVMVASIVGIIGWANVNFVSRAEAEDNTKTLTEKIDAIGTQVNVSAAFQMERGFQDDLDKHLADRPEQVTRRWLEVRGDLEGKKRLAVEYKKCLLTESKNCELLQKQLWQ